MIENSTEEQKEVINQVYSEQYEEYKLWARQYGKDHLKEWYVLIDEGETLPELEYHLVSNFLEWKECSIGEA